MKLYYFLLLLAIFACNPSNQTSLTEESTEIESDVQPEPQIEKQAVIEQEAELKKSLNTTFKDYKIEAQATNGKFKIAASNPKGNAIETADIQLEGEVKFVVVFDINGDGRPEICIVEKTSTGEKLHACSLTPFSALPIHIPMMKLADFQGDDAHRVEDGQLMRTYTKTDGTTEKIAYNLVAGEAGFRLEPHGISAKEMDTKVFGTYAKEDHRQQLTISDNGLGEIVIKITTSNKKDNRSDCNFESVGKLVNGKITAPLDFRTEGLKGTMLLKQIENGWEVFTTDLNDLSELMQFCRGGASLAGSYLKVKE
ncbi:MAG: hypothetical protein AAF806_16245 [Bacteroidota bacterium]